MLNLTNYQPDDKIDKIYLHAKVLYEAKYQFFNNKHKKIALKYYNDFKVFIEYLNDMQDVYKNIEDTV